MISEIVKFIEAQAAKENQKYGRYKWNYSITSVIKQNEDGVQVIFHRCLIFRGLVLGGGIVHEGFSLDPDEAIKEALQKANSLT